MTFNSTRRRRADKRRHDAGDRCGCYPDRTPDTHQQLALVAFLQR